MKLEATPTDQSWASASVMSLALHWPSVGDGIDSAGATGAPMVINDQVQATRVAPDLGVMPRRPAGAGEAYWFAQFDAEAG